MVVFFRSIIILYQVYDEFIPYICRLYTDFNKYEIHKNTNANTQNIDNEERESHIPSVLASNFKQGIGNLTQ